jgi:hypothetical protein
MNFKNFDGVNYEVKYVDIPESKQAAGLCYPPSKKSLIKVDKKLNKKRKLNVLIEEVFHAHFFELPEWKARKFSANLGKLIYNEFLTKKKLWE